MKSIILSVQAKHNGNTEKGLKTEELRKVISNIPTPYKVYTYESKTNGGRGMITNEWICDRVTNVIKSGFVNPFAIKSEIIQKACVSNELIISYSENYKKDVYSMHISDLKVYDKPKELGEFFTKGECSGPHCDGCKNGHIGQGWLDGSYYDEDCCINNGLKRISRPPQNFMFVEDLI